MSDNQVDNQDDNLLEALSNKGRRHDLEGALAKAEPGKITLLPDWITLRDQYALAALSGILAGGAGPARMTQTVKDSFAYADAMLAERDKK